MIERQPAKLSSQILDEAANWFVEFQEGGGELRTREAFLSWLRASPEHVRAYIQIATHWEVNVPPAGQAHGAGVVESIDELLDMARRDANVIPMERSHRGLGTVDRGHSQGGSRRKQRWPARSAIAAGILTAVVALTTTYYTQRDVYSTGIGEQRSLRLEDGSTVQMNARSRIRVRYAEQARQVDLLDGQALFDVIKNKNRPFIVQSGPMRIQAVGTQFDVYRKSEGTVVTVVEGRVAIRADQSESSLRNTEATRPETARTAEGPLSPGGVLMLDAGEQVSVSASVAAQPTVTDVAAATAWTQRRLIFRQQPLADVVQEFNRYNSKRLVIADPAIAGAEVSGTFSSSDPAALLRFLREVGGYVVREGDHETRISRN